MCVGGVRRAVDPALTNDYFGVQIGFDTDENASTGASFGTAWFQPSYGPKNQCENPGAIGADAIFDLPTGEVWQVPDPPVPWAVPIGPGDGVAVEYDGNTFTAVIPIAKVGGDDRFRLEVIARDNDFPYALAQDCAPNGYSIESRTGHLTNPQDQDMDQAFEWLDDCPLLANASQADGDGDFAGDACDAAGSGNVDCDSAINSVDALKVLRLSAGLTITRRQPCWPVGPPSGGGDFWEMGDVDCNFEVNSVDALLILRVKVGLPVSLPEGCPPMIGAPE